MFHSNKRLGISHYLQYTLSKAPEKLEKSLCAWDRAQSKYWVRALWALRQHCIKIRHGSVIKTTSWVQKSSSINSVHGAVHKRRLKLYHAKMRQYPNVIHCDSSSSISK